MADKIEQQFAAGGEELTFEEFATLAREQEPDVTTEELQRQFKAFDVFFICI